MKVPTKIETATGEVVHAPALPELDAREAADYSVLRAIRVAAGLERGSTLERAWHDAASRVMPSDMVRGFLVPMAALNTTTPPAGGNTVFVSYGGWIDALRRRSIILGLGATWLRDAPLPMALPKLTTAHEATFIDELTGITDTDSEYAQVPFAVHTAAAATAYTRQLLVQSGGSRSAEEFVREDLAGRIMSAWDRVALTGTGTGPEPLGLLNMPGLAIIEAGQTPQRPDPATGGLVAWDHVLALEEAVGLADAEELGPRAYLTTPALRRVLKRTERTPGAGFIWEGDAVNGVPAFASRHVPSNLTKGNDTGLHALVYGAWSQLVLATAGVIDLVTDPVTRARRGLVEVVAYSYGDTNVRQLPAFAAIVDAKLS